MSGGPGYLLVIPWELDATGGVSRMVAGLQQELARLGWRPTVLVSSWSAEAPGFAAGGGILRWRVRSPWSERRALRSLAGFLVNFPRFARTWGELARRHDWRVVNVHYPGLSALSWVVLKKLGLWRGRLLLSIHGREIRDPVPQRGPVAQALMRRLLASADAVIACSAELADDLRRFAPGAAGHLHVVANGIDAELLEAELDPSFVLPDGLADTRFILNTGTFEHKKAQDVLIDAFGLVHARDPDVRLVMAGRGSAWLDEMRRRTVAAGLGHRVHFFDSLPHRQVMGLLARASIFCLPSRAEGHPIALLEAAALGVPVVATPVGGIPATIPGEDHGLLVPVGDAPALAAALCRLLADPPGARALGRNLQRFVRREFTGAGVARRYADLATGRASGPQAGPSENSA